MEAEVPHPVDGPARRRPGEYAFLDSLIVRQAFHIILAADPGEALVPRELAHEMGFDNDTAIAILKMLTKAGYVVAVPGPEGPIYRRRTPRECGRPVKVSAGERRLIDAIAEYCRLQGTSPTTAQLARELGVVRGAVHRRIARLLDRGLILNLGDRRQAEYYPTPHQTVVEQN